MSHESSYNHNLTINPPLPPAGGKEIELRDRAVGLVKKFREQFEHYVTVKNGKALEAEIAAARSLLAVMEESAVLDLAGRALRDRFAPNRLRAATLSQIAKNLAELRALFPGAPVAPVPLVRGGKKTAAEVWQDWDEYVAICTKDGSEPDTDLKPPMPRPNGSNSRPGCPRLISGQNGATRDLPKQPTPQSVRLVPIPVPEL